MASGSNERKKLLRSLSLGGTSNREDFFKNSSDNNILYIYYLARSALQDKGVYSSLSQADRRKIKKNIKILREITPNTPKNKTEKEKKKFTARIKQKILKNIQSGGWIGALIPLVGIVASVIQNALS